MNNKDFFENPNGTPATGKKKKKLRRRSDSAVPGLSYLISKREEKLHISFSFNLK